MTGYVCRNCGFRTNVKYSRCPNCDKAVLEKEKSAEELIDSVEE